MEDTGKKNFFIRHWRGELPLGLDFWVNGVVISVLMLALARFFADSIDFYGSPEGAIALVTGLWLLIGAVTAWQFVGIWRAALKYSAAKPNKIWGRLAQIALGARVLQFALLLATQGAPQIAEFWQIASDEDPVGKYQFRVLRDSAELELSGELSFRVSRDAEKYLDNYPTIKIIHLNSPGGRIREARALARLIADRKLSTYTASGCSGSCVIAFAAGQQRLIRTGAHLVFYRYDLPGLTPEEAEAEYEKDRIYLFSRDIDGAFVDKIFATPDSQMWTPSDDALLKAHFITGHSTAEDVGFSGLNMADVPKMEQELLQIPLYAALKQGDPAAYEQVLKTVREGVERGKSLAEIRAVTMPVLQKVYISKLPFADDGAIVEFTSVAIEELKTLQKNDPVICYNYAFSQEQGYDYPHLFPNTLNEREGNAIAGVIGSYSADRKIPSAEEFQADFESLGTSWAKLYGGDLKLLGGSAASPAEKAKACQITISLYQLAVSLPEDKAANVLRYLYDQRNHGAQ